MFFDWNGNGQTDDNFDNFMDFVAYDQMTRQDDENNGAGGGSGNYSSGGGSSSGSRQGCCGTCLLYMMLVPAGVIGLIYGISRLLS